MGTVLATAKAWAALLGSVLTALVGTLTPDDPGYRWLTVALAVVTALATYAVPNKPTSLDIGTLTGSLPAEPDVSQLDQWDGVGRHSAGDDG